MATAKSDKAKQPADAAGRQETTRAAVRSLIDTSERAGGAKALPTVYEGSFGRTLYDTPGSSDGSVTVVMPAETIQDVTSQALIRVQSHPDGRRYVGTVSAGPFYDPDGISAESTTMVIAAVHGSIGMPGHHGRLQLHLLGEERNGRLGPANRRPMPNSPVFLVDDQEMASILGLEGDFAIGRVMGHESVEVPIPVHKKSVLYRHTGVLGTTGGGKSTTITNYAAGSRVDHSAHMSTRQYARLVDEWVTAVGLRSEDYGTHSLRRTKASIIYKATGNLRAVQILLGHTKIENTVRYLGVDVEDALTLAEGIEV